MSTPATLLAPPPPASRPICQTEPGRASSRRPRAVSIVLVLTGIIALFVARTWQVARTDSITSDETTHLVHTLHLIRTGDDLGMWELGAPRLPHALGGLATALALRSAGMFPASSDPAAISRLVLSGMPRVLLPARAVAIGWGVVLLLAVFWGVARDRGGWSGLAAAAVVSLSPECLAHSAIAGSDIPFTASAVIAMILMARFAERPSRGRWLAVGLGVGLAWAMRHSALLLILLAAGVHVWTTLRRSRSVESLAGSFGAVAAMGAVAFLVLWAGDGFGTVRLGEAAGGRLPERIGPVSLADWPFPTSAMSVLKQVRHQNQGHDAFLCGQVRQNGWALYFPIAFLLKTPLGLLALMVLAVARSRPKEFSAFEWVAAAGLALLWLMLVRNKVNIGVRYALLTYPLAAPFVARLFEGRALRDRVWGPITVLAASALMWASISAHPRYLSSFNEIGGGPSRGWIYLADSNIDWGQDFDALGRSLQRLGIHDVTTDISTERRLDVPGVFAVPNPSKAFQVPAETPPNRRLYDSEGGFIPVYTRYFAASVSRLHGLYSQNDLSWLRTRKVVERVGDSIFLFDLDTPADRPFGE